MRPARRVQTRSRRVQTRSTKHAEASATRPGPTLFLKRAARFSSRRQRAPSKITGTTRLCDILHSLHRRAAPAPTVRTSRWHATPSTTPSAQRAPWSAGPGFSRRLTAASLPTSAARGALPAAFLSSPPAAAPASWTRSARPARRAPKWSTRCRSARRARTAPARRARRTKSASSRRRSARTRPSGGARRTAASTPTATAFRATRAPRRRCASPRATADATGSSTKRSRPSRPASTRARFCLKALAMRSRAAAMPKLCHVVEEVLGCALDPSAPNALVFLGSGRSLIGNYKL
mmetsp:Transcript_14306/g.47813  ORF Transcript_14306/g.47813 Transcript_14306/m.47813 type:complete len:292 (+) Transcript_14306:2226-3101(+)